MTETILKSGLTIQYIGFTFWKWDEGWEILVFEHFALSMLRLVK